MCYWDYKTQGYQLFPSTLLNHALKSLESNGIITRTVYPTSPVTVEYSLTEKGVIFNGFLLK